MLNVLVEVWDLLPSQGQGEVRIYQHTFVFLRSILGLPSRTFRYAQSGLDDTEDHVWRCGCAAREHAGACDLVPCGRHADLNRAAFFEAARVQQQAQS
jgi:hypothetical protein